MMTTTSTRRNHRGRRAAASALAFLAAVLGTVVLMPQQSAGESAFSNAAAIRVPRPTAPPGCPTFPPPNNSCPPTSALLYPSTIDVSGLSGSVTDVNVKLEDLTYTVWDASDLDVMLVAPNGTAVMLMSDVCGDSQVTAEYPITAPIDLSFDDSAVIPVPADVGLLCLSGRYAPTDDDDDEDFPFTREDVFCGPPTEPGRCPSSGAPPSPTATALSTFNGLNPNGTWRLYVVDDVPGDPDPTPGDPTNADSFSGQFAGGWSLTINTSATTTLLPVGSN